MKKPKLKTAICVILLIVLLLLSCMILTDYILSTKAQAPIFARKIDAYDADIYRGIMYTIIIDDGYAVSPPGAELKGFFYWGWK